jgi:hypothetical protein
MKYAIVNGEKIEAFEGGRGVCPVCESNLIAKCGEVRIHHWAHSKKQECDHWWESETEWHRQWKGNFPVEWQEVIHFDGSGEKHIADVKTDSGLVIEFQHSHIKPEERRSREHFYGNMVWVVDCTRLKRDYPKFLKGKSLFRQTQTQGLFQLEYPEACFPTTWLESEVHVVFDFLGMESLTDPQNPRVPLYYLFPNQNLRESRVAVISRESFVANTINGRWFQKQKEDKDQIAQTFKQIKSVKRKRSSTHYYDRRRKRFVKKRRL